MRMLITSLDRILAIVLPTLLAVLVAAIVWQVVSRYLLADPSSFTEELARFVLIWVSLLGASYAFRLRMHLGLNLLTEKLTGKPRIVAEFAALCSVVLFAVTVMLVGGGKLMMLTWELNQLSAVMGIKVALVYSVIPVSGVFILVYALGFALDIRDSHQTGDTLMAVRDPLAPEQARD